MTESIRQRRGAEGVRVSMSQQYYWFGVPIFQLKGWHVKKRPVGFRPRVQALPSVAKRPNERWATDLGRARWLEP